MPVLVDVAEEDEIVGRGVSGGTIEILSKSKNIKIVKGQRFGSNFLSSDASSTLFNLSFNTKFTIISS